jgi:hypothetical protein
MELHIYPCFDNILYFPIYLAIDTFRDREGQPNPEISLGDKDHPVHSWKFDDLTIVLEPPTPAGDAEAIQNLLTHKQSPTSLAVAIADPMIVLNSRKSHPNLRVLATFIDRIALWFVARYSPKSRNGSSARIRQLIKHVDENGPPLREDFIHFNDLRIAYCLKGFTTDYVVKYFLAPDPVNIEQTDDFGEKEIKPLLDGQSDITFTNIPWLGEVMRKRESVTGKMEIRQWFPPVPFPFSSVITTLEAMEIEKGTAKTGIAPISEFLKHLYIAVSLSYRYQKSTTERLYQMRHGFRNFGLNSRYTAEEIHNIISQAVKGIVESDCLSEELSNSWVFWDFAFEAIAHGNGQPSVDWDGSYGSWYEGIDHNYISNILKDDIFLSAAYHDISASFVARVSEEKQPLPWGRSAKRVV